LIVCKCSN